MEKYRNCFSKAVENYTEIDCGTHIMATYTSGGMNYASSFCKSFEKIN